jgi:DNA-binding transcriptional regulator YhcF (GntR family)
MNNTLQPLPFVLREDPSLSWSERIVSSVILAFIQGDLKPGDSFPSPATLTKACAGHHQDVLDGVTFLLAHRVLHQDTCGGLRIHPQASPTLEMKQQAFLTRAQQLVRQARQWHLPQESVRLLLRGIAK